MGICWATEALRIWRIAIWPSVRNRFRCRSIGRVSQTGRSEPSVIARSKPAHHGTQRLEAKLRRFAESCQLISGVFYGISNSPSNA
jgi:hypothetical protein